jgi:hypothetical protein
MGKLVALIVLVLVAMAWPRPATAFEPGQRLNVIAYCATESAARSLSEAVEEQGRAGYLAVMNGPILCVDARMPQYRALGMQSIRGIFREKQWTIEPLDSDEKVDFWTFTDIRGKIGYTWMPAEPEPELESEKSESEEPVEAESFAL